MASLPLFLLLLSTTLCPSLARPCHLHQDAAALIAFKSAILSDPLQLLSTWNNSTLATNCTSPCSWAGVRCQLHRVVALQLSAARLTGTLSPSLARLPFLRSLNLSSNNLSGGIPTELGESVSLTSLDLSDNQLSGSIPQELGELSDLQILYLHENELSGSVPAALANCTNLRDLRLGLNNLSGSIPAELGLLYRLELFYLRGNELSGGVPAALGNCTKLRDLELVEGKLSGSIPAEVGLLYQLEILSLWENELSGGVPPALGNCTKLRNLALNENSLSGSIPKELGRLYQLELLSLWGNELSGGVPALLGNCTNLRNLALNENSISGSIPKELARLYQLELLYLWGNELSGGVPAALGNCTNLRNLVLPENSLSGSIPKELGLLYQLELLHLEENELSGGVPATLGNCTKLGDLLLSENSLSGSIPTQLGRLNNLKIFKLGVNRFMGELPTTLTNCTALTTFNVSANQLSGHITDEFCSAWSSLGVLALNDNFFSGTLPPCLSRLERLVQICLQTNAFVGMIPPFSSVAVNYLQVSNNNLSGPIPESLGELKGLVELDLSHNLLSDHIPSNLGSLEQLTALNLSKNALSGSIPFALESCAELISLDLSHNKLTGNLPLSFVSLRSLTKLDLSDNQLEGCVPKTWPYNDTGLVDLSGNPMLKRTCNTTHLKNLQRGSSDLKRTVLVVIVVVAAVLLILGVVIWRQLNPVGYDTNIDHDNRPSHALEGTPIKVSADELREATDGFSRANVLGESGVSMVYKAVLADGTMVALKVLKSELLMGMTKEVEAIHLKREVELLAMVRHRNIVRVLGCCFTLDMQAIVMELVPNGNLDHYLHGIERQDAITKKEKLRLLSGIAQGLEYLHHWHDPRQRIVHCDVKPTNILLDEQWEPLIADFGIAKLLQQGKDVIDQSASLSVLLQASIGYIPPEYTFAVEVSCAGDVYSFGVVMLEILTGKRPTELEGQHETLMSLVQAAYPDKLLGLFQTPDMTLDESLALARLGLSCTSHVPNRRPTMHQVVRALNTIANPSNDLHTYPTLQELLH